MIGYLGWYEACHRLLVVAHGERALTSASIHQSPDGQLRVVAPDPPHLTYDESLAAGDALLFALRAGDIEAVVEADGLLHRLSFLHWYTPPYWADPPPNTRRDRHQDGPILLDRGEFEAWLSTSNMLEVLRSRSEDHLEEHRRQEAVPSVRSVNDDGLRAKFFAWFPSWVLECRNAELIPTREDDLKAAKQIVGPVPTTDGRKWVSAAREEHAPDWSDSGPKGLGRNRRNSDYSEKLSTVIERSKKILAARIKNLAARMPYLEVTSSV